MDLTTLAIPAYILLMVFEVLSFRFLPDEGEQGYTVRDTATSLSMGIGSIFANLGWQVLTLATYLFFARLTPMHVTSSWWSWVVVFVLADFTYYWSHRADHRVRILWASHINHHSSKHYNLSTALRQTWTSIGTMPLGIPMVLLGFPPAMIFTVQALNLLYQFWIHTERIGTMWRPFEFVMNTPSHHRVHHGSNRPYLDRNFGGVFILWDRMLGTFTPESEQVVFGLTRNIDTYNPFRVAFHEYAAIGRDLRAVHSVGEWYSVLFRSPGKAYMTVKRAKARMAEAQAPSAA